MIGYEDEMAFGSLNWQLSADLHQEGEIGRIAKQLQYQLGMKGEAGDNERGKNTHGEDKVSTPLMEGESKPSDNRLDVGLQDATKSKLCSGRVEGAGVLTLKKRMKIVADKMWRC